LCRWGGSANGIATRIVAVLRARARARARLGSWLVALSSAAGDARPQADTVQSGKDRDQIMSLVGLDQPEPDKPRDSVALHFDGTSEDGEALCAMFGAGGSGSVR
jgi:hypothetical protein